MFGPELASLVEIGTTSVLPLAVMVAATGWMKRVASGTLDGDGDDDGVTARSADFEYLTASRVRVSPLLSVGPVASRERAAGSAHLLSETKPHTVKTRSSIPVRDFGHPAHLPQSPHP